MTKFKKLLDRWYVRILNWFRTEDFQPGPSRAGLFFGYYGDGVNDLAESQDHINLAWVYGWPPGASTLLNAISHLQQAQTMGIKTVVLGVTSVYLQDGETWLRQYLDALNSRGLLRDVKALYPIDEPNPSKTAQEVITTNQMVRRVAADFGLRDVKLAVIYAGGNDERPGIGTYDWVGIDDYDQREAIFCKGDEYDELKANLRPDQRILLVPGGVDPYQQDPAPFYNVAQNDPQVIGIIGFIWGDNVTSGIGLGIRSNKTKPRYVECGTRIK